MEKVLILDDESLILASLEHLLEDDYEVFTATDAGVALRLAREHDFAIILSDERMPGLSGHEFLRRVREVSRATRVMMSGYADISVLTEAVNSGQIFAYIPKPWDARQLKSQIGAAVVHFKLVQDVEQQRELLRALMENIPDLIYFKDWQSRFTRVNEAHARNLGATNSLECIGKSDADYFESQDALRWRLHEEEIIKSGRPDPDRIEQVQNPQGRLGWWSTTKVPMFDHSGAVSGIAGISRDVTALINSEEKLREQSERNRMILETANDAFIGMDPDGTITAWNPRAEQTFGWAAAEALGSRWCDVVVAPRYREAHAHGMEQFLAGRGVPLNLTMELVAVHRNGYEFPVEATVWPIRVGGAFSFNAFVRDISERRRAEEARKKETTLVQLLQSVTVAANLSSTIEDTAQICLDRICSYTGWPVGHVYLRADNSPDLISAGLWHVAADGPFAAFRAAGERSRVDPGAGLPGYVLSSGKPHWIVNLADEDPLTGRTRAAVEAGLRSGFGFPILVDDKVMGVLEFFSPELAQPDEEFLTVTGHIGSQLGQVIVRQRAEAELRRAKISAEAANLAKSEFLTTMSHEMRTPMNAILGMADVLGESSLQAEQREYVRVFQKAGEQLLDLINDILDLSKVESGRLELESIEFDLGSVLQKIIDLMASRAQTSGLRLRLEILPSVHLRRVGDPHRLRQILINLLGNALKFTDRGSVTLHVEPDPGGAADWLRFNVVDTGIGISADKTEMIFERFTQADSSTTRKYGGTGLGLAICRGLAEVMGARLGCSSEPGKGSTFYLAAPFEIRDDASTPKSSEPRALAIPAHASAGQPPGSRILIVEDGPDNVALLKAYLRGLGFELDFAANGQIGFEKVVSDHPQLVLMDVLMPVMDGLTATRAIRKWEEETHASPVPILALTADAGKDAVNRSLAAGCNEHLSKPIKKAVLLAAIARHIGKIHITLPEGIEGLVPGYLAKIRASVSRMIAVGDYKDWETARVLGHQFKGTGASYGFPEVTRAGEAVEVAANARREDDIRSQLLALSKYLERVEVEV